MKIVIINGMPRAGKDTFVEFCQKHCTWCLNISTVDFVKDAARFCGWNGEKTPENRKFLSDLKDLLTKWNDIPYQKVINAIQLFEAEIKMYDFDPDKNAIVFIHCREPEEIQRFCDELGALSLLIQRPAVENNEQSNHADAEVMNYKYNFIISNEGSLKELEAKAYLFLTKLGIQNLK